MTTRKSAYQSLNRGRRISLIIRYLFLGLLTIIFLFPIAFAFLSSFKMPIEFYQFGFIPKHWTLTNYIYLLEQTMIIRAFFNTLAYISLPITVGVFMSAMAGYAFARLNFKGKNVIFSLLLATIFIPAIVTLVPSFVLFVKVYKWGGTPLPLIVPGMFGSVITTFYLKQYLSMLPKELEDAAMIDGLNRWGIFTKIMLPLSKSALITQFVLSFIGAYNDYLGPLMYIGSTPELFTVQLVLKSLNAPLNRQYNLLLTGSMLGILPIFLLFVFFQKQIIEGMSISGVRK